MFNRSKTYFCLADETLEVVYEYVTLKFQDTLARNMLYRLNVDYCKADEISEGV
jgi:hypothetical protein